MGCFLGILAIILIITFMILESYLTDKRLGILPSQRREREKRCTIDLHERRIQLFDEYIDGKFKQEELNVFKQQVDDEMERIRRKLRRENV